MARRKPVYGVEAPLTVIGTNPANGVPYFVRDGVVWYGTRVEGATNMGSVAEFRQRVREGKVRFEPKA